MPELLEKDAKKYCLIEYGRHFEFLRKKFLHKSKVFRQPIRVYSSKKLKKFCILKILTNARASRNRCQKKTPY
jgi:hypothetical protein